MVSVDKRAEYASTVAGDIAPLPWLAVWLCGCVELAEQLAGGGVEPVATLFVVNEHTTGRHAEVTAGHGSTDKVIGIERRLNAGQSELPQVAAVIRIHCSQGIQAFHEHSPFKK